MIEALGTASPDEFLNFEVPMQSLADQLLKGLSESKVVGIAAAQISLMELNQMAQRFIVDSFQGAGPTILSPMAIIGGALVMATKLMLKRSGSPVGEDELISLLCSKG